jgi:hypothetical protein
MKTRLLILTLISLIGFSQTGCNPLLAAAAGAAGGQAIGHDTEATLIGAGLGILGNLVLESETRKYTGDQPQQQNVPTTTPALVPDCSRLYTPEERSACAQGVKDRAINAQKSRANRAYQYGLGQ